MTDEPHMDETRPDQTVPAEERPEPTGFGDLPLQPTGSGVADEQMAFEQAEREGRSRRPIRRLARSSQPRETRHPGPFDELRRALIRGPSCRETIGRWMCGSMDPGSSPE